MANGKSRGDRETGSRAPNRARKRPPLYAAVDLGTNNCRLLIAARKRNGFTVLDSHSQIVRLGEGLEASERLSDAASPADVQARIDALVAARLILRRDDLVLALVFDRAPRPYPAPHRFPPGFLSAAPLDDPQFTRAARRNTSLAELFA